MTTAILLLKLVWENGKKDSWGRINHCMRDALQLAIGSGLKFDASDFKHFATEFRWGYWISDNPEWIYSLAIQAGNNSCVEAWEKINGRKPFRANDVDLGYCHGGYIHATTSRRQRERLANGFSVVIEGKNWHVTGFKDEAGVIKLSRYAGHNKEGKPKELRQYTNDEIAALFPSKKKAVKTEASNE